MYKDFSHITALSINWFTVLIDGKETVIMWSCMGVEHNPLKKGCCVETPLIGCATPPSKGPALRLCTNLLKRGLHANPSTKDLTWAL